jgi:uncharacterized membrane protein YvbJ
MANDKTHTCGWTIGPADKYCRGCGERVFKASREYNEIMAEMEALKKLAMEKPHPAFAAIAMMIFNILSWASGDSQTRPVELIKQMEKMADRFPGGFGFHPPDSGA